MINWREPLIGLLFGTIVATGVALSCSNPPPQPKPDTNPPQQIEQPVPIQPPEPQLYTVKGTAFHDRNGSGTKQEDEAPISGIELSFTGKDNNVTNVKTNYSGVYEASLPQGEYTLKIGSNVLGPNDQPFRYFNESIEKFYPINSIPKIIINGNLTYDIREMQGFLTFPFQKNVPIFIRYHNDLDIKNGFMKDWRGSNVTYDQHPGTDFDFKVGTPILACAPGKIAGGTGYDKVSGNEIYIYHGNFVTYYAHMSEITVKAGDIVKRGDQIGLSGNTGINPYGPHLHFQLNPNPFKGALDPFRDLKNPSSVSYWTVDNNPELSAFK